MKKGFTLIELLAVIVILAIIALIVSPIISGVLRDAKEEANIRSVEGIIKSAQLYGIQNISNINEEDNIYSNILFSGRRPTNAEVYVNNKSSVAIAVIYDDKCYTKGFNDLKVSSSPLENGNCTINNTSSKCFVTNGYGTIMGYRCYKDGYVFDVNRENLANYLKEVANIKIDELELDTYVAIYKSDVYTDEDFNDSESDYQKLMNYNVLSNKQEVKQNLKPFVPSKIGNENIVAIYDMMGENYEALEEINISEGIKYIYPNALPYDLKQISVPNSIEIFYTFNTSKLELNKLNGINYIGNSTNPYLVAVSVDDNTKSTYELSNNVKVLFDTFVDTNMTSINIPEGVTHVNYDALGNGAFTNLNIPNSMMAFDEELYNSLGSLATNKLNGVNYIGNSTNPYLMAISVDDKTKSTYELSDNVKILLDTFNDCSNLSSVTIPSSVKYISLFAFENTALTNLTLPEGIIGFLSSLYNTNVTSITLPSTTVFYYASQGKLKTITITYLGKFPPIRTLK